MKPFWRRRRPEESDSDDPGLGRQVWTHNPNSLNAITGQAGFESGPVGGDDNAKIYPDEVDPEWADPDTAD